MPSNSPRNESDQDLGHWLLSTGSVKLYRTGAALARDVEWFSDHTYRIVSLDCSSWETKDDLSDRLEELFPSLHAPLSSSLGPTDVVLQNTILELFAFAGFAKGHMGKAQQILDHLELLSRRLLVEGIRFLTLVHCEDPSVSFNPVGAMPVLQCPRERSVDWH